MDLRLNVGESKTVRIRSLDKGTEFPFTGQASWNVWGPPGFVSYADHTDHCVFTGLAEGVVSAEINVVQGRWPQWTNYRFPFTVTVGNPAKRIDVVEVDPVAPVTPNSYAPILSPG